jgi:NDP-sugar pyrophosphorylase family protein
MIKYIEEVEPLGTAGSISLLDNYNDDFLVLNGDLLTSIDLRDFFNFHKKNDALLSIAVGIKKVKMNLGILEMQDDVIIDFKEKPTFTYYDNMGIYMYNKRALPYIEKNKRLDFNELVLRLLDKNEKVCGYRSEKSYYWVDIGEHADYEQANAEFEKHRGEFLKK